MPPYRSKEWGKPVQVVHCLNVIDEDSLQ